jgi:hypothetical protein
VVLATGNHFLLDVLAGGGCVLIAHAIVELARRTRLVLRQPRKGYADG